MTSVVTVVLGAVALAVTVTGGFLLNRIGKEPDLHKARLFLRFQELHTLHIASMAATWVVLAGAAAATLALGPPPLFPHGVMMLLLSAWALFMAISVTLLVRGRRANPYWG